MTAGTVGAAPPSPLALFPDLQRRTWTGNDGKFETVNGFPRTRWNNFQCIVLGNSVNYPYFQTRKVFIPTGQVFFEEVPVGWNNGDIDEAQWCAPYYYPVSECMDDLLSRIKGFDFNLGVELGQLGQTVSLLAGNLGKLGRAALALKRGDFATAARCLGASSRVSRLKASDISGRWLELQYGWLPLISSCFDAAKAFHELTEGPRKVLFRSSKRRKVVINLSTSPSTSSLYVEGYMRTAILYEMYEELLFGRQLGMEDPASVAWELTPWSFVVDWFVPFGRYLSLLNQIPHLKGRWLVTNSIKVGHQVVVSNYFPNSWGGSNWTGTVTKPPSWRYWHNKVNRVYTESPPGIPSPRFNFGLNSSRRFWNAVSLAHQRFK